MIDHYVDDGSDKFALLTGVVLMKLTTKLRVGSSNIKALAWSRSSQRIDFIRARLTKPRCSESRNRNRILRRLHFVHADACSCSGGYASAASGVISQLSETEHGHVCPGPEQARAVDAPMHVLVSKVGSFSLGCHPSEIGSENQKKHRRPRQANERSNLFSLFSCALRPN